jgi:hypothetical protein
MRNTLDGLKVPDSYVDNGSLGRVGSLRHKQQAPVLKSQKCLKSQYQAHLYPH